MTVSDLAADMLHGGALPMHMGEKGIQRTERS